MAWKWVGLPLLLLLGACSGSSAHTVTADAGTVGASCSPHASKCTRPPAPGNEPPNQSGTKTVIAISKLYLGDTDRAGNADPNAWRSIGYDLDGLISKPGDVNHCKAQPGANVADVETDGNGGIDNSFGENLVPLFESLSSDTSAATNKAIANGKFTVLFESDNLTTALDQNGITGAVYLGANKGSPALFDGSDVWPVTDNSVVGRNVNAPKATFSASYVSGGVWVAHSPLGLVLPLRMQGYKLLIEIQRAVVTMRIHGTGTSATAVDGTIAGVIDMGALVEEMRRIAGAFDQSLCHGTTFDSIAQQILAAADIMSDETNGDPTQSCDAISIGIGFEGTAVTLGSVAEAPQTTPDPCAP